MAESKINKPAIIRKLFSVPSGKTLDTRAGTGVYYGNIIDDVSIDGYEPIALSIKGWGLIPKSIGLYFASNGESVGAYCDSTITLGALNVIVTYWGGGTA